MHGSAGAKVVRADGSKQRRHRTRGLDDIRPLAGELGDLAWSQVSAGDTNYKQRRRRAAKTRTLWCYLEVLVIFSNASRKRD